MTSKFNKTIFMLFFSLCFLGCESKRGEKELREAKKEIQNQNAEEALLLLERIVRLYPQEPEAIKAALEAQAFCLKERACQNREEFFLKFIVTSSTSEAEQISAQKRLSEIYYDGGFYSLAISEMNRLLSRSDFKQEREEIKLKLARSNYYIKNFYQAEVELNSYLKEAATDQKKYEGFLLKADIQASNSKYTEASNTYKYIKENFKDLYLKNQVYMNEALMFEDQKQLDQAIGILDSVKDQIESAEVVAAKIEKLKELKALMPGASGLKK